MSKFFDETVRARKPAIALDGVILGGAQGILEGNSAVPVAANDLGRVRLEHCRRSRLALSASMQSQFYGSGMIGQAEESYRALRTRVLRLQASQGLRSVVVSSAATAEGKTLTSLNLAICCAQLHDVRVLLVDGDIRSRGLTRVFGYPPSPGLAEVLEGKAEPDKAILSTDVSNLYILAAGSTNVPPPELFAGRRWQEFIGWSNESFKLILVDSPPVLHLSDCDLISAACDGVLMVVRANQTRRELLQKAAHQIDAKKLLGVVYNGAENGSASRYPYRSSGAASKER